jgi:putative Mg2+ transporter-C (MgtC) family protein
MLITENQILIRILVAAFLGLLIGIERERRNHDAGLRTHMILVIGAALAMPVSINLAIQYHPDAPTGDPARLAAQVVSGIGFLGAGVIFRSGGNVRGLTTAVSLWTMTIVGLAVGGGYFLTGVVVTIALLVI